MDTARVRIGRVIMKNGGADLRVLRTNAEAGTTAIVRDVVNTIEHMGGAPIDGYVFFAYNQALGSCITFKSSEHVPSLMLPDYVKNRLLASVIEAWTVETITGAS